jgi:uncharacterized protein YndB with AHSA1/START domain
VNTLAHQVDRTILIGAPPDAVFRYFTDPVRWAAWWGAGSTIDPRPGGRVLVRYPEGTEAAGEVLEIAAPSRIVFTYVYTPGSPIPPGGSRVTIRLDAAAAGTRLRLVHEFADAAVRDQHIQGWRYQLSLFVNVVANEIHAHAADRVEAWFGLWTETDRAARATTLAAIAAPGVQLHDRFSCVEGAQELTEHIGAAQHFMPGIRLQRTGDPRHCQGTVLVEWTASGADGQPRGHGTNVFTLGPDGRIESVTGFWM